MSLKHTLLAAAIAFVGGITVLHIYVNEDGRPFGAWSGAASNKFRVGFLPVT
jgi:hypothetical protein